MERMQHGPVAEHEGQGFSLVSSEKDRYPVSSPAPRPLFVISGATRLFPLMTREAVATLTLAPDAISRSPTFPFLAYLFFMSNEPKKQH